MVFSGEIRWPKVKPSSDDRSKIRDERTSFRAEMTSPASARTLPSVAVRQQKVQLAMSTTLHPTDRDERIGMLDATRGIAVLGILIMNVTGFGLPRSYDDPTNWGGYEGINLTTWRIVSLFFEGTMRGLFTLLFGAGALLFLQRHAARHHRRSDGHHDPADRRDGHGVVWLSRGQGRRSSGAGSA
jgi:hypothetical protein